METKIQVRWPTILFVEHGDTDFSGSGDADRIHGVEFDLPLTSKGREQIRRKAEILADYEIASLKHSPRLRSKQSAEIIGEACGVKPEEEKGLEPLDSGYLSGMTHGAAKERIEYYVKHPHKVIPEGETYGGWWETFSSAVHRDMATAKREWKESPGKVHVRVGHSSEVTALPAIIKGDPAQVLGQRLPMSGEIAALEYHPGRWRFIPKFA